MLLCIFFFFFLLVLLRYLSIRVSDEKSAFILILKVLLYVMCPFFWLFKKFSVFCFQFFTREYNVHWYGFFIFGCLDPWIFGFIVFMKCRQFSTTFLNIILFHISPFFSGPPITHVLDYLMLLHSFSQYSFFLYFILNNNYYNS